MSPPAAPQPTHSAVALSPAVQALRDQLRRALGRDEPTRAALARTLGAWLRQGRDGT